MGEQRHWSPDDPEQLMEQFEIGLAIQHESFISVENEDCSEDESPEESWEMDPLNGYTDMEEDTTKDSSSLHILISEYQPKVEYCDQRNKDSQ